MIEIQYVDFWETIYVWEYYLPKIIMFVLWFWCLTVVFV